MQQYVQDHLNSIQVAANTSNHTRTTDEHISYKNGLELSLALTHCGIFKVGREWCNVSAPFGKSTQISVLFAIQNFRKVGQFAASIERSKPKSVTPLSSNSEPCSSPYPET